METVLPRGICSLTPSSEPSFGLVFVKEQVSDLAEIHRKNCWAAHVTASIPENQYIQKLTGLPP